MIQIGIDFGGTKIEAAALDGAGNFLTRLRVPTPGDYDGAVRAVCELVARVESETGDSGTVGIGTPGSISPASGRMNNANSVYLNGRPFRQDLAQALGRDVRMANDANCLALSESTDGAAAGAHVVFGIILGTGCGGGLVVDGRLVEGANGIAGEWGHNPLPWPTPDEVPGPACWCGQHGCLEMWISGTGLQRDHLAYTGDSMTAKDIVSSARRGDRLARETFARYLDRLGRSIATLCNIADPDVIVVGGGLSNAAELYATLPGAVRKHVFSKNWNSRIVPAKWGDSSGVRGAARLWPDVTGDTTGLLRRAAHSP